MRTIPLTRGFFAIIDDCDYEKVSKIKWSVLKSRNFKYAYNRKFGLMHRFIMNAQPNIKIDHKNNNELDNTKKNLRAATPSQNQANRRGPQTNNTSGYLGVCWHKGKNKWLARVSCKNKQYFCGYFDDPIEAAKARDAKVLELFGEFATLNEY